MEVDFKFDEKEILNNFLTEYQQNIPENLWDRLSNCSDYQEAINIVDQAEYNEEFSDEYAQFISQFWSCLENATVERVSQKLKNMIPRMFYFSEYSKLEGRINLTRIANLSEQKEPARTSDQTAKSFLNLAWTDIKAVSSENYEYRKSELEAVSNELTDEVTEYWRQNPDICVEIDIDNVRKNGNDINKYLEFRVEDKKHRYTENLEQRSSGFRWFFSFFAAFTEFEMRKEKVVVLLDEPALSLHGRAQIDFLKFLEDRLAPNVQVIYTTHSPFLVDTSHIHRIRVVQDRSVEEGAIVDDQIVTNDRDSLFPLQGALGYDLAHNLFIGPNNLIVEGPSDFQFITAMKNMLEFHGKTSLDDRWRVIPVGSISKIPSVVAFLGQELNLTVIIDSGTRDSQRIWGQVSKGRIDYKYVKSVSEFVGQDQADIEDTFKVGEYLDLYNAAFSRNLDEGQIGQGSRIVKRVETAEGGFNHCRPSEELIKNIDRYRDSFSRETLILWEKMFMDINDNISE